LEGVIISVLWSVLTPASPQPGPNTLFSISFQLPISNIKYPINRFKNGLKGIGIFFRTMIPIPTALTASLYKGVSVWAQYAQVVFGAGVAAETLSLYQAAAGETLSNPFNLADTFKLLTMELMIVATAKAAQRRRCYFADGTKPYP
jgi:hypothetical protein